MNKKLLSILACPKCKRKVSLNKAKDELICKGCGAKYKFVDEIPIMLTEKKE